MHNFSGLVLELRISIIDLGAFFKADFHFHAIISNFQGVAGVVYVYSTKSVPSHAYEL